LCYIRVPQVICERKIRTHDSVLVKGLKVEDAKTARDSFAKALYGALFDSIIVHINSVISARNMSSSQPVTQESDETQIDSAFIGVLDIFGFECFAKNSFEQLCINYTNEKLQFNFNAFMFQHEQELYEQEGIEWSTITYPDNKDVLDLLENRMTGIFALCDEQVKFPQSTDETLVNKLYEHCSPYSRFLFGHADKGKRQFVVHHYAGNA
jgi:myosin heavy subunit